MSGLSHTEAEHRRRTMPRTAMGKDIAPFYHPWRPFEWRHAYDGRAPSLFGEASAIAGSGGFASIDDDRRLTVAGAAHPPRQHLWLFAIGEQPRDRVRWPVPGGRTRYPDLPIGDRRHSRPRHQWRELAALGRLAEPFLARPSLQPDRPAARSLLVCVILQFIMPGRRNP
jgi:hypothetical protein